MGQVDLQNGVPLALGVCLAAGCGVAWFARAMGRAAPFAGAVGAVLCAVPALVVSWPQAAAAATSDLPRAWSEAALATTPPRGVALVQSDSVAAGTMFLTWVEGARPDVAVIVRQHLAGDAERTAAMLARADAGGFDPARPLSSVLEGGRPVTWELGVDGLPPGYALWAGVPLSHLAPRARGPGAGEADDLRRALARLRALFEGDSWTERSARRTYANALTGLGRQAYGRGELDFAAAVLDAALAVRPEHVAALVNRGAVAGARAKWHDAAALSERALALDPFNVPGRLNAIRYRLRTQDYASARRHADVAIDLAGDRADAWALSGIVDANLGEHGRAVMQLQHALRLDPGNLDAREALARYRER
jgi:tetratricopeptide (TPR) repeat protein